MKKNILIVDDEMVIHRQITRTLGEGLYQFIEAFSGQEGLVLAMRSKPDLILLDIDMPDKNGFEVMERLRHNTDTLQIPIIILTGHNELATKIAGFSKGADDYILKPFEADELRARVRSSLQRSQIDPSAVLVSKLPGRSRIEEAINERIQSQAQFSVLMIDIDGFKSFNDVYGYSCGDQVIGATANLILKTVNQNGLAGDFVGHFGGDDFIVLTEPLVTEELARAIGEKFDNWVPSVYSEVDRQAGGLEVLNRNGQLQKFPLLRLSIAIATNERRSLGHLAKILDITSEILRYLKVQADRMGSAFLKDRRLVESSSPSEV